MPFVSGPGGTGAISGVTVSGTAAAGQVPVASSAAVGAWGYPPGFEIGYAQITTNTNITDTAEGTATSLISPGALTFDGAAVLVTFFAPGITTDTAGITDTVTITLWEGATQIARLGTAKTEVTTAVNENSCCLQYRFTPTAASHTYKLCAFATSTSGTPKILAGTAGVSTFVPAFLRFTKV